MISYRYNTEFDLQSNQKNQSSSWEIPEKTLKNDEFLKCFNAKHTFKHVP